MRGRALIYLVPASAVLLAAALAVLCLVEAVAAQARPFPGFLLYTDGAVTSLMRRDWQGPRQGLLPRDIVREVDGVEVRSARAALGALSGGAVSW
jgi:hypothetical protein